MAWCKRDVSEFFRWNFFSFKSAWIFACAFQLSRKTSSCIVFPAEMLLFCFVVFIVHASIFCLCFSQKQSANQAKEIQGNVVLLNWKAHAKMQALLKEKKFHLKKSLMSLLHQAIQLSTNIEYYWLIDYVFRDWLWSTCYVLQITMLKLSNQ